MIEWPFSTAILYFQRVYMFHWFVVVKISDERENIALDSAIYEGYPLAHVSQFAIDNWHNNNKNTNEQ